MFRYINMPKLVAFYLREFSTNQAGGSVSILYKFIFCLCLPFLSQTFREARLRALAIAECTNSADQIAKVLNKLTGATLRVESGDEDFYVSYDATGEVSDFNYDGTDEQPLVPYEPIINFGVLYITLNGASQTDVEAYLRLLIPFYYETTIIWQ